MKKKKRTWQTVFNEILSDSDSPEKVSEERWEELFSLSTCFHHYKESHWLTNYNKTEWQKWTKKFLEKMMKAARENEYRIAWWWSILRATEKESPEWKESLEKVYESTKRWNILYRWQNIRQLLPENHPYMKEVTENISALRKKRKNKK